MSINYKTEYHKWKHKYLQLKGSALGPSKEQPKIVEGKDVPKFILEHTFPLIKDVDRNKTQVLESTIRLMAGNDGMNLIADAIQNRMGSNIIITNITPNFGSDLINMAFRFQKLITINPNDITLLKHNINLYDLTLRVRIINEPILSSLKKTEQEVIYTDGFFLKSKKVGSKSRIYIDSTEISELVNLYKERSKLFVFRIPTDYDFNHLFDQISGSYYEVFAYKKNKIGKKIDFYFILVMSKLT